MNQQINLFQPIFRKERKILSSGALVQICGIMIAALAALYGYGAWSNSGLTIEISGLKKRHDERITMLERISRQAANSSNGDEVAQQIQRLEAELVAERYIASLLSKDKLNRALGFSEYLEIFSRRVVQGMWISKFSIVDGGEHMLIKGGALSAELVPLFLQGLSEESSLAGLEFTVLQMARDESNRAWIEFVLSSKELETPNDAN
ncbi:MAG: hypothetical protein PVF82_01480 [Gammaproteobacteria bacterium]|jgi:hypothetical protein